MAEKKRKGAASVPTPPTKKSKKTPASEPVSASKPVVNELAPKAAPANEAVQKSKSGRKRASEFLADHDVPPESPIAADLTKSNKKSKKSPATTAAAADQRGPLAPKGLNGTGDKTAGQGVKPETSTVTVNGSVAVTTDNEAPNGLDTESEEENARRSDDADEDDQGTALLAGFDSDSDDPAEDQGDVSKIQPIPHLKKTTKKLKQAKEKGSDRPGAVYIGRIPHGFYEHQMRDYFSQFGNITRLRLSRNRRTGRSKHFAFVEFESDEVAKIVAETMDNYLMFGHILKCKYAPSENLHPEVWKGANKRFRKVPHDKIQRQQLEAPKTHDQWAKKVNKEQQKRQKQAEKMKAIGYEYVVPQLKNPSEVVEQRKREQEHGIPAAMVTDSDHPNAIAAPPDALANDASNKKQRGSKKASADVRLESLTESNLEARNAGPAAESAKVTRNRQDQTGDDVSTAATKLKSSVSSAKPKKSKEAPREKATATISSHGEFDNLSSIPVGTEAAPPAVTDAVDLMDEADDETHEEAITTVKGVADTVLAGRKSDRKKAKSAKRNRK